MNTYLEQLVLELDLTFQIFNLYRGKTIVAKCQYLKITNTTGIIGDLIVYKRFRRRGFGSELLQKVINETNTSLMLWVENDNKPAINLYRKHGFVTIGSDLHDGIECTILNRKRTCSKKTVKRLKVFAD